MNIWQEVHKKYGKHPDTSNVILNKITELLAEAQGTNAPINEERRKYFHSCNKWATFAFIPTE